MVDLIAVYVNQQTLDAVYPTGAGAMNINIDEYPFRGNIIVPKGDTARIVFNVYNEDGGIVNVDLATDIKFAVAVDPFSPPFINCSLLTSGITIAGNEITVTLSSAQTRSAAFVRNYFELWVQLGGGRRTVASGVYRAVPTLLGLA